MATTSLRPCGDFRTTYKADQFLLQTRWIAIWTMLAIALLGAAPALVDGYIVSLMILIGIYGIAALGLNILVGMTGQISLGHAAFFGFGAFSSAWLNSTTGIPVFFTIPLAGLMTTAVGMIFGLPAARIKGLYLAIATLASQFILQDFFARANWFSGGSSGSLAETVTIFGFPLDSDERYYYLVLFWTLISLFAVANLKRSRDGRALVAVRDHYLSAEIMGINLTKYRILAFGISSFFAGLGGALFGHYLGYVSAEGFTILLSIQFLAMIIIGGLGSVMGTILGTAFIVLLPQFMEAFTGGMLDIFPNALAGLASGQAYIKEMSVGAAIILFLIFEPEGLAHRVKLIRQSWKLYPFSY
ncbi:branched-chain amino acid ABC transporter permease [Oricola cellulosilytica]|uniref:Branched-chain amino acid ABC transporter permease n=1 Tax=Oricola cellulosilytica TaxID=1429082 RepID=A0A4R0PDS8_9HYPH|nr:branched-chain amino acid ABC transporter permease [Oricola cellulosilytica]TCD14903.1 branched-chain amino acid ABC transporter permease [Oricola cellulosilytica]